MILDDKPYTFDRVFRLAISIGLILAGILLLKYLSDVLIPFFIAFLLAYLLNPIVNLVQKKFPHRFAAVVITLMGAVLVVVILCLILTPMIMDEVEDMGALAQKLNEDESLKERANNFWQDFTAKLPEGLQEKLAEYNFSEEAQKLLQEKQFWSLAQKAGETVWSGAWNIVSGTLGFLLGLLGLIVIALYLVFMLLDYQKLQREWEDLIPPNYREPIMAFIQDFDAAMNRYFRSQAVIAGSVGVCFAIGFTIVGLPMGIVLGLFIGLLNMVPYLQILGLLPALLLAVVGALNAESSIMFSMLGVVIIFAVVQIIQDAILTPRIMGKVTGLSPAMILLSISVWGKLLGFLGLIVALPMTCLVLAYYKRLNTGEMKAVAATISGEAPDDKPPREQPPDQ